MNLYIVTGSTRGLGGALCEAIGQDASNELIALGRAPDAPIAGGVRLEVDLADTGAVEKVFDRIDQRIRGKHYEKAVLINNAGIVEPVAPLERAAADALERNLVVNLVAPILLMRRFLVATERIALMRRIINISSGAGRRPISGWTAYCASKAGLDMASRVVALEAETRRLPVEVVSLAPGVIDTGMQETVRGKSTDDFPDVARFQGMKDEGVLQTPESVAAAILRAESGGRLEEPVMDLRSLGE